MKNVFKTKHFDSFFENFFEVFFSVEGVGGKVNELDVNLKLDEITEVQAGVDLRCRRAPRKVKVWECKVSKNIHFSSFFEDFFEGVLEEGATNTLARP